MKLKDKVISYIDNGYGIVQLMTTLNIDKKQLIEIAESDDVLLNKLKKRYVNIEWVEKINFKGASLPLSDADTPELAALKMEAKELGIQFNPTIGAEKLRARIEEFKKK